MYLSLLKWVGPPVLVLLILAGVYFKGRSVERRSHVQEQLQLILKRKQAEQKVIDHGVKIKRKVDESRQAKPIKDDRDSCLLSTDPLEGACESLL